MIDYVGATLIKECEFCGNKFENSIVGYSRKFCSKECANKSRSMKYEKRRKEMMIKECEWCETEFLNSVVGYNKRFCSKECVNAYNSFMKIGDKNPMRDPVIARKNGDSKIGKITSDCTRRKMSENSGMKNNADVRKQHSDLMKQRFIDHPEEKDRMRQIRLNQKPKYENTEIEIKIQQILKDHDYSFEIQVPLLKLCIPDIVFQDKKIIIQCDGDYWHNYPDGNEQDRKQDKILTKNGWRIIRFWEHEINENIQDCLRKFEAIYNDTEYEPYYTQGTLNDWM